MTSQTVPVLPSTLSAPLGCDPASPVNTCCGPSSLQDLRMEAGAGSGSGERNPVPCHANKGNLAKSMLGRFTEKLFSPVS